MYLYIQKVQKKKKLTPPFSKWLKNKKEEKEDPMGPILGVNEYNASRSLLYILYKIYYKN